ncbi:MAG: HAMP domain-containing histidine kinase [Actinomycetales bacterium]|nr:HAMP domain-containing histidine kinase [Actinomycetales bacterium]
MTIGVVGLTVALTAAGVLMYAVLSATLSRSLAAEARAAAVEVATLVDQNRLPDPVPVSGALLIQVFDSGGRVLSGSLLSDRITSLLTADEVARAVTGETVTVPGSRAGLSGRLEVAAVAAGPATARVTVVAGVPTADRDASLSLVSTLLLVGLPLLLLVLGVIAWRVIGSAFAPVEALRLGAERIGAQRGGGQRGGEQRGGGARLELPAARDEVHALGSTLNAMLARLEESSAHQRAFLADAAHELRSPLATMRTQLEVAGHLGDGGSLPSELLPEVERLTRLVDDLLVLARTGAEAGPPRTETVSLPSLLAEIATRYAAARVPVDLAPGLALDRTLDDDLDGTRVEVLVSGDRGELRRAIANLVDNSVRHAATRVVLDCGNVGTGGTGGGSGPWVSVRDDGHGIPAADRDRVFERFTRLDDARDRDSGGSGLGLAIARELLRRNGADVALSDAPHHPEPVRPSHPESGATPVARPGLQAIVTWTQP